MRRCSSAVPASRPSRADLEALVERGGDVEPLLQQPRLEVKVGGLLLYGDQFRIDRLPLRAAPFELQARGFRSNADDGEQTQVRNT